MAKKETEKERDVPVHVQSVLMQSELDRLKQRYGTKETKEAIQMAVYDAIEEV